MARSAETGERQRFRFTRASVDRAVCPPGKQQAIYRDTDQPGLGLRVTAAGIKSFIYESKLGRQTIRMTIGPASMQIRAPRDKNGRPLAPAADDEAQRLARMVGQGVDPRLEKAGLIAEQAQQRADAKAARLRLELSGLQAWTAYCKERRPHWRGRSYVDHLAFVDAGGKERRRSKERITKPGPLRALLARPLAEIDAAAVEQWVTNETRTRPARAALGFRLLRAFINWCAEHPEYRDIAQADACKGRRTREKVGKSKAKNDALQREQLAAWFAEVRKLSPTLSAYLQCLLLTGARREELMALRWEDIDFRWGGNAARRQGRGRAHDPVDPLRRGAPSGLEGAQREAAGAQEDPPWTAGRRAGEAEAFAVGICESQGRERAHPRPEQGAHQGGAGGWPAPCHDPRPAPQLRHALRVGRGACRHRGPDPRA